MKVLLLVNWRIKYCETVDSETLPSDQCFDDRFWFFHYFKENVSVDVVDTRSISFIEKFEKKYLRFYIMQSLKVLPNLKKYDLIISHGTTSGIFLDFIVRLFHLKMPPHIVVDISSFHKASTSGIILKFCQFASKKIDYLIYHSPVQEKYFDKYFPWLKEKKQFITFGADGNYWGQQKYHKLNIPPYILCVGYRMRDWDTLIEAYESSNMKYDLVLIGNDSISVKNERIKIIPFLKINKLMDYIYSSQFCILPLEYLEYSFGQMTLLQQMAIGKFVIAADTPSLEPYESEGLVKYKPGDVKQLAKIMEFYFEKPELVDKLGKKNKVVIEKVYSEQNMAQKFEQICKEMVK